MLRGEGFREMLTLKKRGGQSNENRTIWCHGLLPWRVLLPHRRVSSYCRASLWLRASHETPLTPFSSWGADACHHPGLFRPTEYLPLHLEISPSPIERLAAGGCAPANFSPGRALANLSLDRPIWPFQPRKLLKGQSERSRSMTLPRMFWWLLRTTDLWRGTLIFIRRRSMTGDRTERIQKDGGSPAKTLRMYWTQVSFRRARQFYQYTSRILS